MYSKRDRFLRLPPNFQSMITALSSGTSWIPVLLASGLAGHGLRKRSLSPSGAAAAFIVGALMLSVHLRVFGVSLIMFYLLGSRVTRVGKNLKQTLEEGHDTHGGGYRNAQQGEQLIACLYSTPL